MKGDCNEVAGASPARFCNNEVMARDQSFRRHPHHQGDSTAASERIAGDSGASSPDTTPPLLQVPPYPPVQARPETNRAGLPTRLANGLQQLSGIDVSDVQVHRGSSKPQQLQAHAYAQGSDIHLGPGQDHHLPHEAWHIVQQRQGRVRPTGSVAGTPINEDKALEREADRMGARAARHAPDS